MIDPDSKRHILQDQVNAKIYWGAQSNEILEWLNEKGINGAEAATLERNGRRARAAAIRRRAALSIVFSNFGLLLAGGAFALWWHGGLKQGRILAVVIGCPSAVFLLKNFALLLSGETDEPLD